MKGSLYLIPTPIDGESSLGEENLNLLKKRVRKRTSLYLSLKILSLQESLDSFWHWTDRLSMNLFI